MFFSRHIHSFFKKRHILKKYIASIGKSGSANEMHTLIVATRPSLLKKEIISTPLDLTSTWLGETYNIKGKKVDCPIR